MSKKNKKNEPIVSKTQQSSKIISSHNTPQAQNLPHTEGGIWGNTCLQAIIIFAVSFLLYANTLTHDFCQDDAIVITENMFTTQGVSGISGILSYDTFYGFFKEAGKSTLVAGGRYRPFTLVMFAIEYQIFGKTPFIGHFMNIVWFGLTCVLLYFLLLKLLKYRSEYSSSAAVIAFITALLFAAHPIHTEVVANIKGRDEIMTLLGSLAAVWFSLKFYEKGGILNTILAALFFFIGLMSKENAITFVVIVPLIYWFFVGTDWGTAFKQVIPFGISAVLFLILRGAVIGNQFTGQQLELMNNPYLKLVNGQYIPFDMGEKLATIVYTLGKYIQLLIVPHPLTHDYYPRHIGIMSFGDPSVFVSIAIYIGLGVLILRGWQKRDIVSFSLAFFLITLSIVSNLVFPVGTNMAERFMFMPSIGFCLVLAVLLSRLLKDKAVWVSVAIALLFSVKTFTRNFDWKDNYTIFTTDVKISENSAKLQCSAGGTIIESAANEPDANRKKARMNEAVQHLRKALEIHPQYKNPYLLLGNAYIYLENYEQAIKEYQNALALDPQFKEVFSNIALAYRENGRIYAQMKNDLVGGAEQLAKSVQYNPQDGQAWSYYGTALAMSGQTPKAIEALEKALSLRFDKNDAMNLSTAYRLSGDAKKSEEWAARMNVGK